MAARTLNHQLTSSVLFPPNMAESGTSKSQSALPKNLTMVAILMGASCQGQNDFN